jgi:hypothetical protein
LNGWLLHELILTIPRLLCLQISVKKMAKRKPGHFLLP